MAAPFDPQSQKARITRSFANNVRMLRISKNLQQKELADQLNWHRITITRIENGQHIPTYDNACLLADALGVDVGILRHDLSDFRKVQD